MMRKIFHELAVQCLDLGVPYPDDDPTTTDHPRVSPEAMERALAELGLEGSTGSSLLWDGKGKVLGAIHVPCPEDWSFVVPARDFTREEVVYDLKSWKPRGDSPAHAIYSAGKARLQTTEPVRATDERRHVTLDGTVLLHDLRPELFAPEDAVVMGVAASLDLSGHTYRRMKSDLTYTEGLGFCLPVSARQLPIDAEVMAAYQNLARVWIEGTPEQQAQISTGDLLCAATALSYDMPMYTTRPGAYRFLKNKLKVIKYGPIRNSDILVDPPKSRSQKVSSARKVPADPVVAAQCLQKRYADGEGWDATSMALFAAASADATELGRAILHIIQDEANTDPAWKTGLLKLAVEREIDVSDPTLRESLAFELLNLAAGYTELSDAAKAAYGEWGEWAQDWEDVLDELGEDEHMDRWYPALLRLKGVSKETVRAEAAAIAAGAHAPSQARFEELTAAVPPPMES